MCQSVVDCVSSFSDCVVIKGLFNPEIFRFFLKSEGKDIERKRKKGMLGGGGYLLTYFWGCYFFEWG